jgi:hypothetical protein
VNDDSSGQDVEFTVEVLVVAISLANAISNTTREQER